MNCRSRIYAAFFSEAYRVLKPGGLFLNMELPPNNKMEAYDRFYLDWDCYYNKEPYYKPFRDQDYVQLCTAAGFSADKYVETVIPRYTYTDTGRNLQRPSDAVRMFDDRTGRLSDEIQLVWLRRLEITATNFLRSYYICRAFQCSTGASGPDCLTASGVDELMSMVLELTAEVWVIKKRLYLLERVAGQAGVSLTPQIENYDLSEAEITELDALRRQMIATVLRSLEADSSESAEVRKEVEDVGQHRAAEAA